MHKRSWGIPILFSPLWKLKSRACREQDKVGTPPVYLPHYRLQGILSTFPGARSQLPSSLPFPSVPQIQSFQNCFYWWQPCTFPLDQALFSLQLGESPALKECTCAHHCPGPEDLWLHVSPLLAFSAILSALIKQLLETMFFKLTT